MRDAIGRLLCASLGALYTAGLIPLFNYGEIGQRIFATAEGVITQAADVIGIPAWLALALIGPSAVAGPWAVVWLIAGKGISRWFWFLVGIASYGAWWIFA